MRRQTTTSETTSAQLKSDGLQDHRISGETSDRSSNDPRSSSDALNDAQQPQHARPLLIKAEGHVRFLRRRPLLLLSRPLPIDLHRIDVACLGQDEHRLLCPELLELRADVGGGEDGRTAACGRREADGVHNQTVEEGVGTIGQGGWRSGVADCDRG